MGVVTPSSFDQFRNWKHFTPKNQSVWSYVNPTVALGCRTKQAVEIRKKGRTLERFACGLTTNKPDTGFYDMYGFSIISKGKLINPSVSVGEEIT